MHDDCKTCKHLLHDGYCHQHCSYRVEERHTGWEPKEEPKSKQVGGDHYASATGVQPIEFIVSNNIKWREGNVIKYVFRHEKKNKLQDLLKARHYLDMIIEEYQAND